jgi:membrane AbrB-like protein
MTLVREEVLCGAAVLGPRPDVTHEGIAATVGVSRTHLPAPADAAASGSTIRVLPAADGDRARTDKPYIEARRGALVTTNVGEASAIRARMARLVPWVAGVAGGVVLGVLLKSLNIPGPWILSFIISFAIVAFVTNKELEPYRNLTNIAQVTIAMLMISPLVNLRLSELVRLLPYVVAITLFMLILSLALARLTYVAAHRQKDALTIVLSMLPGASSAMTTMARELGADHRYVALIQYLRMLIVTLTLPIFMHFLESGRHAGGAATAGLYSTASTPWQGLIGVALILLAVPVIKKVIRIPVPYIFIPMIIAIMLAAADVPKDLWIPPPFLTIFAYAVIGIQAGGAFTRSAGLIEFAKFLPIGLTAIAVMIGAGLGLTYVISALSRAGTADAFLAATPGGLQAVFAFANETSAEPIVLLTQVTRAIVMLVVPVLMTYVVRATARATSGLSDKSAAAPASSQPK